ncbi:hypothetical protein G6011_09862 [Alternaria panax]|uniref:Uncharacterized protein n=1 Tax=Alternaria panax TaxID=48097 RepID=A0AAD4FFU3_9PLEO|nr:hypothetical protein G6011_09862 [Alternaria panax]
MSIVSSSMPQVDQTEFITRLDSAEDRRPSLLAAFPAKATSPGSSPNTLLPDSFASAGYLDNDAKTLTRLFLTLNMDPGHSASCNSPAQTALEVPTPTVDTASLSDLEPSSSDSRLLPWVGKQAVICETKSLERIEVMSLRGEETHQQETIMVVSQRYGSRQRTTTSALKYPLHDVSFPSLEVYPFPRDQERRLEIQPTSTYYDISRKNLKEYILKVNKFESAALGSNTAATTLKWRLANAYSNLGLYNEAVHQLKRILPALEHQYGKHSHYVTSTKTDLAQAVLCIGRFQEAHQMAQDVHTLARSFHPGGGLYQQTTMVLAQSFRYLGDLTRVEELRRENIQVGLSAFGPRHGNTIAAINYLSKSIAGIREGIGMGGAVESCTGT